jgi:MFS family permease
MRDEVVAAGSGAMARAAVIGMAGIFGLTYSLTASVIALDLAARGAGDLVIGLNAAMHAVGVLLLAPVLPTLTARYNGRPLVLAALLMTAIVLLLLPLVPAIWMWFPLRLLLGIAAEILFVLSETWTTQLSGDAGRGRAMAVYVTAMSLGFAAGPVVVSLVGSAGFLPFGIGIFCTLLTMLVAALPGIPRLAVGDEPPKDPRRYLRLAPLGLGSAALNAAIEAAGLSFLPLYAMASGWSEESATRLIATLMVGAIVLQLPVGWLADRVDRRRLVVWLAGIAGVAALAWPLILGNAWLAYAVLFAWGGVFVGIYTTLLTILGSRFRGTELVGVYAVMGMFWGVGALAGPLLVGLAMMVSVQGLPLVAAVACLAFAGFAARLGDAA